MINCSNCGADAEEIPGEFPLTGRKRTVTMRGITLIHCPKCGNDDPMIPHISALMRLLERLDASTVEYTADREWKAVF